MSDCPTPDKKSYRNKSAAQGHVIQLIRPGRMQKPGTGRPEAYRCMCGRWHVGHPKAYA